MLSSKCVLDLSLTPGNQATKRMNIKTAKRDPTDRTLVTNDAFAKFKLATVNTFRLLCRHTPFLPPRARHVASVLPLSF